MFVPSLSWPNDHFKYEMAQKDVFPYRHRFLRRTSWSHRRRLRGEGVGERAHQPVRFRTVSEVFNVWSSLEPIECVMVRPAQHSICASICPSNRRVERSFRRSAGRAFEEETKMDQRGLMLTKARHRPRARRCSERMRMPPHAGSAPSLT